MKKALFKMFHPSLVQSQCDKLHVLVALQLCDCSLSTYENNCFGSATAVEFNQTFLVHPNFCKYCNNRDAGFTPL